MSVEFYGPYAICKNTEGKYIISSAGGRSGKPCEDLEAAKEQLIKNLEKIIDLIKEK